MNFRTRDPREIRATDAKMLDSRGRCSLVFVGVRGTRDRRRTAAAAETDRKWTAALARLEPAAGERYIGLRDDREHQQHHQLRERLTDVPRVDVQ